MGMFFYELVEGSRQNMHSSIPDYAQYLVGGSRQNIAPSIPPISSVKMPYYRLQFEATLHAAHEIPWHPRRDPLTTVKILDKRATLSSAWYHTHTHNKKHETTEYDKVALKSGIFTVVRGPRWGCPGMSRSALDLASIWSQK